MNKDTNQKYNGRSFDLHHRPRLSRYHFSAQSGYGGKIHSFYDLFDAVSYWNKFFIMPIAAFLKNPVDRIIAEDCSRKALEHQLIKEGMMQISPSFSTSLSPIFEPYIPTPLVRSAWSDSNEGKEERHKKSDSRGRKIASQCRTPLRWKVRSVVMKRNKHPYHWKNRWRAQKMPARMFDQLPQVCKA